MSKYFNGCERREHRINMRIIYLAGLVVHVESDDGVRGQRSALQPQQVSRQLIGQVGLSCTAGARQDDASVLLQQGDVALQHRLRDQSVEHQRVHVLTAHTWTHTRIFITK